jgi:type I restriction enzyme S subunit
MMFDIQLGNERANLSMGYIAKVPDPLPPLEEQKRIVAKVIQLMALCDELEGKLRESRSQHQKLMKASTRAKNRQ